MVGSQVLFKLLVEFAMIVPQYGMRRIARSFDPDVFYHPKKFGFFGGGYDTDQTEGKAI